MTMGDVELLVGRALSRSGWVQFRALACEALAY
jgi:hypothetical protein